MMTQGEHDHDGSMNNSRQRYFEGEHNHKGSMSNNSTMTPSNHDYEKTITIVMVLGDCDHKGSNSNNDGIRQP